MEELELNPETLAENPHIAAVELLEKALDVAAYSLIAAHSPGEPHTGNPSEDILSALTMAILNQIDALEATLMSYERELAHTTRRSSTARNVSDAKIPW